ncbi:outer membrane beta-barrel protein [Mucilaginibacter angelicae]|uniref:Outer membrane beta-barrel protein n=1 Tax=Mucilaginibacter angelicae TaxID=869718 RepID=A0ABV6LFR2_9SPHI
MKDLFKDPDLWRQKRAELPVDSEPQSGWQEMQSILDKHLPVLPVTAAPHVSKLAKIVKAVKAMKATSILIASLTVATVTGTAIYLIKNEQHKNTSHHQPKKHNRIIGKDSLNTTATSSDSLINLNTGADDSLQALKVIGTELAPSANKTDSVNNTANINPSGSSNIKTGASASKNGLPVINQQTGSGSNTPNHIVQSNHNNGSYIIPGKHHGGNQSAYMGSQSTQNGLIAGTNTMNSSPNSNFTQNGNSINGAFVLSANTTRIGQSSGLNNNTFMQPQIFANQPLSKFVIDNPYYNKQGNNAQSKNSKSKNSASKNKLTINRKTKSAKISSGRSLSTVLANVDWGVLLGANSSGSFTQSAQNSNFYGSFPVDIYAGLFGTYHLNNRWAINAQVRLLTPLNFSGSYTNENSGVDSAKLVKVTDSRKAYFVSIPVHAVYKITNNISVKGGPVINIPVKQINGITNVRRLTDNIDTIFLANTVNQLKTTRYDQKINLGLSGGISFQFNRLSLEALYQKSLGGYNITSGFGNYKNSPGTVQISVGFKLNSSKHH